MFVFQYICIVSEFRGNAEYDGFGSCLICLVQKGLTIKDLVLCLQFAESVHN